MPSETVAFISRYGYLAIFTLVFLQEVGVPNPIPNELVLMFSGYLTFSGILRFPLVILATISGDFTGTGILYVVFYFFGTYILKLPWSWLRGPQRAILRFKRRIGAKGAWAIFVGRLTPFLRGYTSVVAGLIQMKPKAFLPLAVLSGLTWSLAYVSAGLLLGPYWGRVTGNFGDFRLVVASLVLVMGMLLFLKSYINKKLDQKKGNGPESDRNEGTYTDQGPS